MDKIEFSDPWGFFVKPSKKISFPLISAHFVQFLWGTGESMKALWRFRPEHIRQSGTPSSVWIGGLEIWPPPLVLVEDNVGTSSASKPQSSGKHRAPRPATPPPPCHPHQACQAPRQVARFQVANHTGSLWFAETGRARRCWFLWNK